MNREMILEKSRPKNGATQVEQLVQAELQPDREHQEHDPELRKMRSFVRVWNPRQRVGADRGADQEISEQRRQVQPAKQHHDEHGARQQYQHQLKRVAHSEVLVFLGSRGKKRGFGLVYSKLMIKGASGAGQRGFSR